MRASAQLLWKLSLLELALWGALELTKDPALVMQLGPGVRNPGLAYSGPICLGAGSRCSWLLLVVAVFWLAGDHHAVYVISVKVSKQNTACTVVLMAGSVSTQIQLNVRTHQLKLLSYRLYVFFFFNWFDDLTKGRENSLTLKTFRKCFESHFAFLFNNYSLRG